MFNKPIRHWMALTMLVLATSCGESTAPDGPTKGEWHTFSADWAAASGERHTLHLGPTHAASIFKLSGAMLVTGDNKIGIGFRAEAVGFTDRDKDKDGSVVGSSVWTDERGDKVFSALKGEALGTSSRITGTFLGGTGRYAGATGEYEFQWQYVISADEGEVSGRVVGLKGRVRFGAPEGKSNQ